MEENRAQALERILTKLDSFDPSVKSKTPATDAANAREEVARALLPFLQNPERHARHVSAVLRYQEVAFLAYLFRLLGRVFPFGILARKMKEPLAAEIMRIKAEIQGSRNEILASVDTADLKVDVLPLISLKTKPDWVAQGRRLILIELRSDVLPAAGMQLVALSQQIQIVSPVGCQFVDTIPSNEMESLGEREVSVTERGKFVFTSSDEAKVAGKLSYGPGKLEGAVSTKDTATAEGEHGASERLKMVSQMARTISSAVGDMAAWRLLRTPSQLLLGTNKFSATALVPIESTKLEMVIRFGADIERWGPTSIQRSYSVPLPDIRAKNK